MRILKDDFTQNQPVSAITADWLNTVAKFINKLTGSRGIVVDRTNEFPKVAMEEPGMGESPAAVNGWFSWEDDGTDRVLYFTPPKFDSSGRYCGVGSKTEIYRATGPV